MLVAEVDERAPVGGFDRLGGAEAVAQKFDGRQTDAEVN